MSLRQNIDITDQVVMVIFISDVLLRIWNKKSENYQEGFGNGG